MVGPGRNIRFLLIFLLIKRGDCGGTGNNERGKFDTSSACPLDDMKGREGTGGTSCSIRDGK